MTLCLQYLIVYHQATNHVDRQTVRAFSGILGLRTGNLMIYLHYFILFGISLFTVALKFISEESAQPFFTASCLYGGIFLFYIGLWLANRYNRIIINGWWVSSLPRPLRVSWQQVFGRRLPPLQSLSRSLPRPTPPA